MVKLEESKISKKTLLVYMCALVLTGSANTIVNKIQQNTVSLNQKYEHQKFITFCMFIGEFICLGIYYIQECLKNKKETQDLKEEGNEETKNCEIKTQENSEGKEDSLPEPKWYIYPIATFFDLGGSTIIFISLTFLASSVFEMLNGAVIILTAIGSIIFLKRKYYSHHYFSMGIVIAGLIIIALDAVLQDEGKSKNPILGIILCIGGQVFYVVIYMIEETLLKGYKVSPLKVVGLEGFWGTVIYIVLFFPFYFIRCESWGMFQSLCVKVVDDGQTIYRFEDAIFALKQIYNSNILLILVIVFIFSNGVFNFCGISVTKYASSTARTIIDPIKTTIIWGYFLINIGGTEDTKEKFHWEQLVGFALMVCGSLIFNEIFEIPFFGLNSNTERSRQKKEALIEEKEEDKESKEKEEKKDEKLYPEDKEVKP